MKLFSILSIAAAVFAGFVAASPVAVPAENSLVARDASGDVVNAINSCKTDVTSCGEKWKKICHDKKCGEDDFKNFDLELGGILNALCIKLKLLVKVGVVLNVTLVVNAFVSLCQLVNVYLTLMVNSCGVSVSLAITIIASLKLCISILSIVIGGVLNLVLSLLGCLLGIGPLICSCF